MKIKLLALLSLFCFAAQGAFASTPVAYEIMGVKYRLNTDGTAEVYKCDEKRQGDVKIESTLVSDGSKWTTRTICESAFAECRYITSVTIPNTVTSIERAAFYNCRMESVTIPNSVKTIGEFAFCGSRLTSVVLPFPLKTISANTFYRCSILASVTISENVTTIESEAFSECPLTSIYIPKSVTSIASDAFRYCTYLENINVDPDNKMYTSVDGVLYNKSMTSILHYPAGKTATSFSIPNTVTKIGDMAFEGCSLTSVKIPNTVKSIGRSAFNASKLTSINIPNSVKNIGAVAFSFCENLSTVTIPSSVTSIGDFAFSDCGNLKTVNIYNAENVLLSPSEYHPCPFERVSAECVLYVPESIREQYEATAYNDCFSIILGMTDEMLDIENAVKADGMAKEKDRFDLRGNKLDAPQRGINIVRMSDGTVKKVFVK